MAFNNFPYTDAHELNLDWVIKTEKDLKSELGETKSEIDAVYEEVQKVREDMDAFASDINDIVSDNFDEFVNSGGMDAMFYKKYRELNIIICDTSYGVDRLNIDGTVFADGWPTRLRKYAKLTDGTNFRNISRNGAFLLEENAIAQGTPTNYYLANFQGLIAGTMGYGAMTADARDAITDIVIGGCTNDSRYPDSINYNKYQAAFQELYNYLEEQFPNARIWLAPTGWQCNAWRRRTLKYIYNTFYKPCAYMCARACYMGDMYQIMSRYDRFIWNNPVPRNDMHPTNAAATRFAIWALSVLYGGQPTTNEEGWYNRGSNWNIRYIGDYADPSADVVIGTALQSSDLIHVHFQGFQGTTAIDIVPINLGDRRPGKNVWWHVGYINCNGALLGCASDDKDVAAIPIQGSIPVAAGTSGGTHGAMTVQYTGLACVEWVDDTDATDYQTRKLWIKIITEDDLASQDILKDMTSIRIAGTGTVPLGFA